MGSFSRRGNAFGNNSNSNISKLMQASAQPFGDDSWKHMADFGVSTGNSNESRSVLNQLPTGATRTVRPLIVDSSGNLRTGRVGMASGRQIQPSMNGMLGQGIAYSSADADNNWRASAPLNKVLEEFDPLQSIGACSLPVSKENVSGWMLPSCRHRTDSGLPRSEPNAPTAMLYVRCGALENHNASKCTVSLEEKKKYKKSVNQDTGFSLNGKRVHFRQGQQSKKHSYRGGNFDKQKEVMPKLFHENGVARRDYQQSAMQGLSSTKPAIFGTLDNQKMNMNRWDNGIAQRGRITNLRRQVETGRHGRKGKDQTWYDIAELVQTSRIEKICQRMRLISGLLLNGNDYKALEMFSYVMSQKISIMKRKWYEKDQSEKMFNEIMEYLREYQNRI